MKKYKVTITYETVVYADDKKDALEEVIQDINYYPQTYKELIIEEMDNEQYGNDLCK